MRRSPTTVLTLAAAVLLTASCAAVAQPPVAQFESMADNAGKLHAVLLTGKGEALAAAIRNLTAQRTTSSLFVLATAGVPDGDTGYSRNFAALVEALSVLDRACERDDLTDAEGAALINARVELASDLDAIATISARTAEIKPATPEAEAFLREGLPQIVEVPGNGPPDAPPGAPPVGPPPVEEGRFVRSPWPPLPPALHRLPEEEIRVATVGTNECMVEVKEIFGVKRRVRWIKLPIWIEPWTSRARIVGFETVWIYEWVPAEFIKKIITCNDCCNNLRHTIEVDEVTHPELLDYWSFYRQPKRHD